MEKARTNLSHSTGSTDSTKSVLHKRRSLNTTPNTSSPVYPSSVSRRERNDSQSSQSSLSLSVETEAEDHDKSSPLIRTNFFQYYRDEPINPSGDHIKSHPSSSSFLSWLHRNRNILLVLCLFALPCFGIWYYFRSADRLVCPLTARSRVSQLSRYFPTQSQRLWAQLRSAMDSGCTPHKIQTGSFERTPVVILLVRWKCPDVREDLSQALFRRFVQCVGQLTVKLNGHTEDLKECQSLIPPITDERRLTLLTKAEQIKQRIHEDLSSSYESGNRCFHLDNIDLLPPETVVLFHGMADSQNSPYKEATLLFSLDHAFELDRTSEDTSYRSFEHQVQRYLRSIWVPYLGDDKVSALLSRLTPNIGMFYTNQTDPLPPMCQV
ncbi:hypothetical protein FGIG_00692 [Fasciola gigantica]|uniref:Uncharacterized protein n=1 Tax=Fasciola gigantica TaxID=46835 RepID=A0A504YW00_FASGI|nr:hypothetical protein FGIG_00692 [Fasciola gigantica]